MKKIVLILIDGIGLGEDSADNHISGLFSGMMGGNKLVASGSPVFFDNGVLIPTDAVMGVPGIPQSATGQTSIFTGVNAQKYAGVHISALPDYRLADIIKAKSLMKVLKEKGVSVTSANLYSDEFFEKRRSSRRNLFPVSTLTIMASESPFRQESEYLEKRAVFADITNKLIRQRGYDIPLISPEEGAERVKNISADYDFVFFEYFMTDIYGHKRNKTGIMESVDVLNRFVESLWNRIRDDDTGILIVSDHGNAEDFSTGDHTENSVPTILFSGNRPDLMEFSERIKNLTDIYDAVCENFG